jgi:hypothetical protein
MIGQLNSPGGVVKGSSGSSVVDLSKALGQER